MQGIGDEAVALVKRRIERATSEEEALKHAEILLLHLEKDRLGPISPCSGQASFHAMCGAHAGRKSDLSSAGRQRTLW